MSLVVVYYIEVQGITHGPWRLDLTFQHRKWKIVSNSKDYDNFWIEMTTNRIVGKITLVIVLGLLK